MKLIGAGLLAVVTTTVASAQPVWTTYRSPDGDFTARFPSTPTVSSHPGTTPEGQPITHKIVTSVDGPNVFMVGYFDVLATQTFSIEDATAGMVKNVNGALLDEIAITFRGHPGRELTITGTTPNNAFVIRARVIHTPSRAYIVQTIFSTTAPHQGEQTARFFNGFQVAAALR